MATSTTLPSDPKLIPNVKFIHFFSAGTDHVTDTPVYKDSNITLTTSSGIHGPQIAEWVVMQMLAFNHHQKEMLGFQREHKWGKVYGAWNVRDYIGQRLGVLGYGSIGRQSKLLPFLSLIPMLKNHNSCSCLQGSRYGCNSLYCLSPHDT